MSSDTVERVAEIRKRCDAATAAPWIAEISPDGSIADVNHATLVDDLGEPATVTLCEIVGNNENDAKFIAHAREDVPWLCAVVGRQAACIGELEAEHEAFCAKVAGKLEEIESSMETNQDLIELVRDYVRHPRA